MVGLETLVIHRWMNGSIADSVQISTAGNNRSVRSDEVLDNFVAIDDRC